MNSDILEQAIKHFRGDEPVDIVILCVDFASADHLMKKFLKEAECNVWIQPHYNRVERGRRKVSFIPYMNYAPVGDAPDILMMDKATERIYMKFLDINGQINEINR